MFRKNSCEMSYFTHPQTNEKGKFKIDCVNCLSIIVNLKQFSNFK